VVLYLQKISNARLKCAVIALWLLLGAAAAHAQREATLVIARAGYTLHVDTTTLAIGAESAQKHISPHVLGNPLFAHATDTGIHGIRVARVLQYGGDSLIARVTNTAGLTAKIRLRLGDDFFSMTLTPEGHTAVSEQLYRIDFGAAPLSPAYGLGDHGGFGASTDVTGFRDDDFGNRNNEHRFISTFTIFPAHNFAQVLFSEQTKRVAITPTENRLGVAAAKAATVYYFFGTPKQIYQAYKQVKAVEGYPDLKPKYRFFELGYEAFGSLGWNTYQSSVEQDIAAYLEHGYLLKWAVVGSGFWKGERRKPTEGATTSFGIWDDAATAGRKDGLPNPRYPDPQAFKDFFAGRDISLLLGLRINFKAPKEYGGFYTPENDGKYMQEGLTKNYFTGGSDGKPETYRVNFPQGNVFLLDGGNPEAVEWYVAGADRWGVDGFKEDLMLFDGKKLDNDAKLNKVNEALMDRGYLVMARNSAYSVAGDILRLEDTKHGFDQDRPLINGLNYAASGVSAVYLDIVAGKYLEKPLTDDQKLYFVRNAMAVAVSPVMAMGYGPWHLESPTYEIAVKKAAHWHAAHAAYIYSEAVKGYHTGFPYAMTPLPLAFPHDSATYRLAGTQRRQYAWMLGESLLATPLYGNDYATAKTRSVYLPAGRWMDYETKQWFQGPTTLENYPFPLDKIPVFVGGKGVVIEQADQRYHARVYPTSDEPFTYRFYFPDGERAAVIHKSFAGWRPGKYRIENRAAGQAQIIGLDDLQSSFAFPIEPAVEYHLTPLD